MPREFWNKNESEEEILEDLMKNLCSICCKPFPDRELILGKCFNCWNSISSSEVEELVDQRANQTGIFEDEPNDYCVGCETRKPLTQFHKSGFCKPCFNAFTPEEKEYAMQKDKDD